MSTIEIISATLGLLGLVELRIKRLVKVYLKELIPNGGSSMKDQINKLTERQEKIDDKIDTLTNTLISTK